MDDADSDANQENHRAFYNRIRIRMHRHNLRF